MIAVAYRTKHRRHCVRYGRGRRGSTCREFAPGGSGFDGLTARQKASPTRGWRKAAPKTRQDRRKIAASCGDRCFLGPGLSFPVCRKCRKTRCSCSPDCHALSAAFNRARQYKHPAVASKALSLAKRAGCRWAKE